MQSSIPAFIVSLALTAGPALHVVAAETSAPATEVAGIVARNVRVVSPLLGRGRSVVYVLPEESTVYALFEALSP